MLYYRLWLAADVVVMVVVAAGSRGGAAAPTSRLVTLAVGRRGPASPRATGRVAATATVAATPWCCAPQSAAPNQSTPVPCRPPALSLPAEVSRRCMFRSWSRSAFFVSLHCSFSFLFSSSSQPARPQDKRRAHQLSGQAGLGMAVAGAAPTAPAVPARPSRT